MPKIGDVYLSSNSKNANLFLCIDNGRTLWLTKGYKSTSECLDDVENCKSNWKWNDVGFYFNGSTPNNEPIFMFNTIDIRRLGRELVNET